MHQVPVAHGGKAFDVQHGRAIEGKLHLQCLQRQHGLADRLVAARFHAALNFQPALGKEPFHRAACARARFDHIGRLPERLPQRFMALTR
jgi:hypothetical protein